MKEVLFQLKNLCYKYNKDTTGDTVLSSINQVIHSGEHIAIIGGNGSGKTTLAKHLNGLLLPCEGSVLVKGMDTREKKNISVIRQLVGMVFQNPENQIVAGVVEEDVAFGPENLGIATGEIKHRVEEALMLVGLTQYRQFPPENLSGGEKQRLAIAGALAMRPECLVMDEATSMLDEVGRQQILGILHRLNRDLGVTLVQITHNMEEAALADRVWVLKNGRVILEGPPQKVFKQRSELVECGLELPDMAEVAHNLKNAGFTIPEVILSVEDMVSYLCRL
ncbi:energy-coupling factor transporter ATPase [Desulfolucanica intricata]|uniref:energy-coupling factor transporter ATPase n=1 Tax=Desulfolucanica intricata TaxID=1285191 RepID=UPI00082ED988|nr:energy-coupling factor transporter ATPase [Desulfolucanica intricata]